MTKFSILFVSNGVEPTFDSEFTVTSTAAAELDQIDPSTRFDCVVLGQVNASVLKTLRANFWLAPLPVFATTSSIADHPLCDGAVPEDLAAFMGKVTDRAREYPGKLDGTAHPTILAFLWALDTRRLIPDVDLNLPKIYDYDLLNGLGVDDTSRWLADAERKALISPDKVVARTRNCGECGGAHLNYVDRCPSCDGLDILPDRAIHCFTCGLVAEEGTYARGERLVCPKCQTALKHIGTDYDRPIERHRCGDCGERFNDARVKATCLECGTVNAQDALRTQTYRSYRIGSAGESLIRLGQPPADTIRPFGEAQGKDQFQWTLSWLNAVAGDSENAAVLAKISIGDLPSANDEDKASIASLRSRVGALLSPCEVVCFHTPGTTLLLLPQDGPTRLDVLANALQEISSSSISDSVKMAIEGVQLPQPGIASDAARWLEQFTERDS